MSLINIAYDQSSVAIATKSTGVTTSKDASTKNSSQSIEIDMVSTQELKIEVKVILGFWREFIY